MFNSVGFKAMVPIADLCMKSSASTELKMCINFLDSTEPKAMRKAVDSIVSISDLPKINMFTLTNKSIIKHVYFNRSLKLKKGNKEQSNVTTKLFKANIFPW